MQQRGARTEPLRSRTNIYHNIGTTILKNAIAEATPTPQFSINRTSTYTSHSVLTEFDSLQTGLANMVRSWAPATCGEFVQGAIDGRDFLVNAPIDLYSCATVRTTTVPGIHLQDAKNFTKVQSAFNLLEKTHCSQTATVKAAAVFACLRRIGCQLRPQWYSNRPALPHQ